MRAQMTLDDVATQADQEFELCEDVRGELEYPVRAAKFSGVCTRLCAHSHTHVRAQASTICASTGWFKSLGAPMSYRTVLHDFCAQFALISIPQKHQCFSIDTQF